ncbi:META domain-containing protein [Agromyces sp. NPDC060279]|uniref:META domain-containing protein n=1 Tax=Agromyces sp. NPDC060279 TaxID=3347092 RepID=UPI00364E5355
MRTPRILTAAVAVAAAAMLTGCVTDNADPTGRWQSEGGVSLTFDRDGSFTGDNGCTEISGTWTANDVNLSFDDVVDEPACTDGEDLLAGLDSGTLADDSLTLYADDEAQIAVLQRAQ